MMICYLSSVGEKLNNIFRKVHIMKNLAVSLFILFFLLIGCKDENNIIDPPGESIEIVPLEVGNSWIFQITTYDSSANIISNNIDTAKVVSDTLINGKNISFSHSKIYDGIMS